MMALKLAETWTRTFALGLPGGTEWILILLVVILLFGATKIPQLMRGIGRGTGEFKKGLEEGRKSDPPGENQA
ncbi:MAG TPA: twin-arginine translocase TatA/TatE family subunit [Fimbriimonadaceae bacterium]|nr:twin-arginine translocase TatA/TatE family subunit [Fimbriimonadaceae bacterium]